MKVYYAELENTSLQANISDGEINNVARTIFSFYKELRQPLEFHRLRTLYETYQLALRW